MFRKRRFVRIVLHHDHFAAAESLLPLTLCSVVRLTHTLLVTQPTAAAVVCVRLQVRIPATSFCGMLKLEVIIIKLVFKKCS